MRNREDGVVRRFIVISEQLAGQLFGGATETVGQLMLLDFQEARVVGVVRDVSSIFRQPTLMFGNPSPWLMKTTWNLLLARLV